MFSLCCEVFSYLFTEKTDKGLQLGLQQLQKLLHKHQVVRLAHAEVVIEGHVVEELGVLAESLATEEAAAVKGEAVALSLLHQQHLHTRLLKKKQMKMQNKKRTKYNKYYW